MWVGLIHSVESLNRTKSGFLHVRRNLTTDCFCIWTSTLPLVSSLPAYCAGFDLPNIHNQVSWCLEINLFLCLSLLALFLWKTLTNADTISFLKLYWFHGLKEKLNETTFGINFLHNESNDTSIKAVSFNCLQNSSAIQANKLTAITLHVVLALENLESKVSKINLG